MYLKGGGLYVCVHFCDVSIVLSCVVLLSALVVICVSMVNLKQQAWKEQGERSLMFQNCS